MTTTKAELEAAARLEGPQVRDLDTYSVDIRDRARVLSKRLRGHGIAATDHDAYMVMCAHLDAAYKAGAEQAAKVADKAAEYLRRLADTKQKSGHLDEMYRANTAWHQVTAVAAAIRSMFDGAKG